MKFDDELTYVKIIESKITFVEELVNCFLYKHFYELVGCLNHHPYFLHCKAMAVAKNNFLFKQKATLKRKLGE